MSFIGWTCQKELPTSWPSWGIVVCTVKHLGTSLTISLQPLTLLPGSVSVLRTDNNFSYPAADLTRTAVGLSRLLLQLSRTRYLTNSKIRHVVLTVFNSSSRQTCLVFSARQHICYSALYAIARLSVRPSVCPSVPLSVPLVCHTGGSVKDGYS